MAEKEWNEYAYDEWQFEGRRAVLVKPDCEANGKWAIYTEYFWAFPNTAIELLERGWHIAFLENINRWGLEADQEARHHFCTYLHEKYGLSDKCVPIGMSCGGLHAIKYAGIYPNDVSMLYLDAPVVNLLSCPMKFGKGTAEPELVDECLNALQMTESEMISYRRHPMDYIHVLVENKIPALILYGDMDEDVYYDENGLLLENAYKKADIPIQVICKKGCGHHPHGLEDPAVVADAIERLYIDRSEKK